MAIQSSPPVLSIGHSQMSRLVNFREDRGIGNFGLPSCFPADVLAMTEATLSDLPSIIEGIVPHSPTISFFHFRSFDLLSFDISVWTVAWASRAFFFFFRF